MWHAFPLIHDSTRASLPARFCRVFYRLLGLVIGVRLVNLRCRSRETGKERVPTAETIETDLNRGILLDRHEPSRVAAFKLNDFRDAAVSKTKGASIAPLQSCPFCNQNEDLPAN